MADMARELYGGPRSGDKLDEFVAYFSGYRLRRSAGRLEAVRDVIVQCGASAPASAGTFALPEPRPDSAIYDAVPTWGPHAGRAGGLAQVAKKTRS